MSNIEKFSSHIISEVKIFEPEHWLSRDDVRYTFNNVKLGKVKYTAAKSVAAFN